MTTTGTPIPTDSYRQVGPRLRAFVLLRLTLVIATSYLVLAQDNFRRPPDLLTVVILLGLLSNLFFLLAPKALVDSSATLAAIIVGDTVWITAALVISGRFHPDFFYLYFFILFIAAIGENLRLIVLGAGVACVAYLLVLATSGSQGGLLSAGNLVRIPFLLAVAAFYGHLVDRVRREQRRVHDEKLVISGLRESQRVLAETNARLEHEIQERRRVEEELKKVSEMKSAFVSTVSHELRTPLTAIRNAVDLLAGSFPEDAPEDRFLAIARRNVDRLGLIVNDLLDISKIEAGRLDFSFRAVDLKEALAETIQSHEEEARQRRLRLDLRIPEDLPTVWADTDRLAQVITNLVGNAVKFTPAGGVVTISARPREASVELSVSDTGPGLAAENLTRIFEPFYQAGDPLTGKAKGTGLGLSIARKLVRAHGSDLEVESEKGRGCRFFFSLPLDSPAGCEVVELERLIREYRSFPVFSLLVATPGITTGADAPTSDSIVAMAARIGAAVPRSSDHVTAQPANGRLLIVLLGTPREGGAVVRRNLASVLTRASQELPTRVGGEARIHGPAVYPEDGETGFQLIQAALRAEQGEVQ